MMRPFISPETKYKIFHDKAISLLKKEIVFTMRLFLFTKNPRKVFLKEVYFLYTTNNNGYDEVIYLT